MLSLLALSIIKTYLKFSWMNRASTLAGTKTTLACKAKVISVVSLEYFHADSDPDIGSESSAFLHKTRKTKKIALQYFQKLPRSTLYPIVFCQNNAKDPDTKKKRIPSDPGPQD